MKSFFRELFIYLSLIFLILSVYGFFCEWFFTKEKYFPDDSKRAWSMKQQNTNYDYAVLGSSRAEGAFDMSLLDSLIQQKGINIGCNGSGFVDNYLVFSRFIQNHNKIKTLFLQVDVYSLDPEHNFSNSFHVYNFLPFWNKDIFKTATTHYLSNSDSLVFTYLPWMRFYLYNKYFSPFEVLRRIKNARSVKSFKKDKPVLFNKAPDNRIDSNIFYKNTIAKEIVIQSFDVDYLKKIIALAKENGIKVVLFTAPDFFNQESVFLNYQSTKNALDSILNPYSLIHINAEDSLRRDISLFKDPAHLNRYGKFLHTLSFAKKYLNAAKLYESSH